MFTRYPGKSPVLFCVFLLLCIGLSTGASCAYVNWAVYREDDGGMDSIWGWSGSPNGVLRKTFELEEMDRAVDAMIRYEIGANPYHYETREYPSRPREGVEWNDMVILVNGVEIARDTPMELGVRGWHRVRFDPAVLKEGENTVDFTWADEGTEEGRGGFYLGIDTQTTGKGRSLASMNRGRTFSADNLNTMHGRLSSDKVSPDWQGEYMVRLHVGFPPADAVPEEWGVVFSDDFGRSDVFGPDWSVKEGDWDVRGHLIARGPDAVIMSTRRLRAPFRVEYRAYSDDPCDLSLVFQTRLDEGERYSVQFGGMNNTMNRILVPEIGEIAAARENLIEPGRVHRVVVEVDGDGHIRQKIDGEETLSARADFMPEQLYFGFYVWTEGVFDSVRVYSPSAEHVERRRRVEITEVPVVRESYSFNDFAPGDIPGGASVKTVEGDGCRVRIADVPTWEYYFARFSDAWRTYDENRDPSIPEPPRTPEANKGAGFMEDPCVELFDGNPSSTEYAGISLEVPYMGRGMIEFDVMAVDYEKGLRVELGENTGLFISEDGDYYWMAGRDKTRLRDRGQLYPSVRGTARFYLEPERWFTIRISFDLEVSLAEVALVRLFSGVRRHSQTEYLVLGQDLPLPLAEIGSVKFRTSGPGRFFIDNIFFVSRTEDLLDEAAWRKPGYELMTAYYPLRKDPLRLKRYSMRNIRFMEGSGRPSGDEFHDLINYPERYSVILESAGKYNRIMVRQAFLSEKMRGVERAWHYGRDKLEGFEGRFEELREDVLGTKELLGGLFRFYAYCYLDRLDQEGLAEGFGRRHAALEEAIENAERSAERLMEEMREAVEERTGAGFVPYPVSPPDDHLDDPVEFLDGAFRRNGKRDFLFVKHQYMICPEMERTLLFSPAGANTRTDFLVRGTEAPDFAYETRENNYFYRMLQSRPGEQVALRASYGQHNHVSYLPEWWIEKNSDSPSIFLQNSLGDYNVSSGIYRQYNYWNRKVREAQENTLKSAGRFMRLHGHDHRVAYLDLAQEAYFPVQIGGRTWETGHNSEAVEAFREMLEDKYGSISALNEKWGSDYGGFSGITPPQDWRLKPELKPGLRYEFNRFRHDSWREWMSRSIGWLREGLMNNDVPASCQITYPGQNVVDGLDLPGLYETFDIVMEHYKQQFADDPGMEYRYHENLRQVHGTSTGIGEWYVSGPGDIFDEQAIRNNGLRQFYQNVQWGRSVLSIWQGNDFMFLHNGNATENRLGHTLLRYHAAYIPLGIARAKAHRGIYLEKPLIAPDVGVLESETSFYNVQKGIASREFSSLLFREGHDFGYLFEHLLMEGRQSLDGYKAVLMQNSPCLPDEFADMLLGWVGAGGVLITTGAPGVMNEYAVETGYFPDRILGEGNWSYDRGRLFAGEPADGVNVLSTDSSGRASLIEAEHGAGRVFMRLGTGELDKLYGLIEKAAPRRFFGEENRFHMVMREGDGGTKYLSLLNPDCYETIEDEIVIEGRARSVADISCNFPVIPEYSGGRTRFSIKLAPAEGVMLRIER